MKYRIHVLGIGGSPLVFSNVDSYTIKDGFLVFIDTMTKKKKMIHSSRCEIEETP